MADAGASQPSSPAVWDPDSLRGFYKAFHELGSSDWSQVAAEVGPLTSPAHCEALYRHNTQFLSLQAQPGLDLAFVAMVQDRLNSPAEPAAAGGPFGRTAVQAGGGDTSGGTTAVAASASEVPAGALTCRTSAAPTAGGTVRDTAEASTPMPAAAAARYASDVMAAAADGEGGMVEDDDAYMDLINLIMQKSRQTPRCGLSRLNTPTEARRLLEQGDGGIFGQALPAFILPVATPRSASRAKGPGVFGQAVRGPTSTAAAAAAAAAAAGGTLSARSTRKRLAHKAHGADDSAWHGFGEGVDALLSLADVAEAAADQQEAGRPDVLDDSDDQHRGFPRLQDYQGDLYGGWDTQQDDLGRDGIHRRDEVVSRAPGSASARSRKSSRPMSSATAADDILPFYDCHSEGRGGGSNGARCILTVDSPRSAFKGQRKPRGGVGVGGSSGEGSGTPGVASADQEPSQGSELWGQLDCMGATMSSSPVVSGRRSTRRSQAAQFYSQSEYLDVPWTVPPVRVLQQTTSAGSADFVRGTTLGKRGSTDAPLEPHKRQACDEGCPSYPDAAAAWQYSDSDGAVAATHGGATAPLPVRMRSRKPAKEPPSASTTPSMRAHMTRSASVPTGSGVKMVGDDAAVGGTTPRCARGVTERALQRCLGGRLRHWVQCEWHYSAIDRPFFMKNELQDAVSCHLRVAPGTCLTRVEWALVRAAFGRPRRLSLGFLKEERTRLEAHRESVRRRYQELGPSALMPLDLPRPLRVGQPVVARHPATRQLHDGHILTIKGSLYRVQFARAELMSDHIRDVDVMPVNPLEHLPATVLRPASLNGRPVPPPNIMTQLLRYQASMMQQSQLSAPGVAAGKLQPGPAGRSAAATAAGPATPPAGLARAHSAHATLGPLLPPALNGHSGGTAVSLMQQLQHGATLLQQQQPSLASEADCQLLEEAKAKLDAKEAVVKRLRGLNLEAEEGTHRNASGHQSDQFQEVYSSAVLQLKEANDVLDVALEKLTLRQSQVQEEVAAAEAAAAAATADAVVAAAVAASHANGSSGDETAGARVKLEAAPLLLPATVTRAAVGSESAGRPGNPLLANLLCGVDASVAGSAMPGMNLPMGPPPPVPPRSAAAASAPPACPLAVVLAGQLVHSATAEARALVSKCQVEAAGGTWVSPASASPPVPATAAACAAAVEPPLPRRGSGGTRAPARRRQSEPDLQAGAQVAVAAAAAAAATAAPPPRERLWLSGAITSCVGMLLTMQRCTQGPLPPGVLEASMDLAVHQLRPVCPANHGMYMEIIHSMHALKTQLSRPVA